MIALPSVRVVVAVGAAALIFPIIVVASPVSAQNGHPTMADMPQQGHGLSQKRVEAVKMAIASHAAELELRVEDRQQIRNERLKANQLKACQNRQAAINSHASRAVNAATTIEAKFASIAAKVDTFKISKGVTVDSYEELKADVSTKKTAVDAAVEQANTQLSSFSCDSDGPKAQMQLFVSQMDVVRQALKDYRTSIKNLIQGVRQANGQNRQASSSAAEGSN
jgi:hypothetical protein